jgi:hypothetical protein
MRTLLSIAAALLLPALASADVFATQRLGETPRDWIVEVNGTSFYPDVNKEASLNGAQPYTDAFGQNRMWLFGAELEYELWQGFGTVAVGGAVGYANVYGHGHVAGTGEPAPDITTLRTVPVRLLVSYRFDYLARRWGIPLVPFGKIGPADTFWWATNGTGDVSSFPDGSKAYGGKWGYELTGGLALELNFFDRELGDDFDRDFGVNSVYLHAAYTLLSANNFGRPGLDLSSRAWVFGLGFEF